MNEEILPAFAGGILAGGKSERMGTPKAELVLAGKPLVCYPLDALRSMRPPPTQVVVAVAPGYRLPSPGLPPPDTGRATPERDAPLGLCVVEDLAPHQGPLAGLLTVLEATSAPATVVLACDTPYVSAALLEHLLRAFYRAGDVLAVTYVSGERTHPFPGIYSGDLTATVSDALAKGERSMLGLLSRIPLLSVPLPEWALPYSLESLNTPEDYHRALDRLRS